MRVLQHMKRDDEPKEEIRTLPADPEEIHEVMAKAWQDIYRRCDNEAKPTRQNFERTTNTCGTRNHRWKWVDCKSTMMKKMKTWRAKKAAGPDGWARSEWKQMTPEMMMIGRHSGQVSRHSAIPTTVKLWLFIQSHAQLKQICAQCPMDALGSMNTAVQDSCKIQAKLRRHTVRAHPLLITVPVHVR